MGINRSLRQFPKSYAFGPVLADGYVRATDGSGGVAFTLPNPGDGYHGISNITNQSTGIYRVVLQDEPDALLGFVIAFVSATASDLTWQIKEVNLASKYIDVRVLVAGSAANLPSGAGMYVFCNLKGVAY